MVATLSSKFSKDVGTQESIEDTLQTKTLNESMEKI
jgi:hypothetical protein